MKKIVFLLGMVVMATSLAYATVNYELQADGTYKYVGAPVSQLVVDFTTWSATDLPTPLADQMPAAEKDGMAFVKWKIAERTCGDKGVVNALFNNDFADWNDPENPSPNTKNNVTSNPPRIYLPTTTDGVGKITLYAGNGKDAPLKVYYKDEKHAAWTYAGDIILEQAYGEKSLELNSKGQTTIYIEYTRTMWIAITNLELGIGESVVDPNKPQGELDWDQDGTYWGDSVNYIYENFNEWPMNALEPEIISEDIQQYKKLGFIRWKMAKRNTLVAVDEWDNLDVRTSLFTNNPEIDGYRTTDSAHNAMIYLPTLKHGAGALRMTGFASTQGGNAISLQISYYNEEWDEFQAGYTWIKGFPLPADGSNVTETSLDIEEPVTLRIAYNQSPYPTIWSIQVSPYGYPLSDDPDTDFADIEEGLSNVYGGVKALKMMVKGQLILVVDGKTYNVQGIPVELK